MKFTNYDDWDIHRKGTFQSAFGGTGKSYYRKQHTSNLDDLLDDLRRAGLKMDKMPEKKKENDSTYAKELCNLFQSDIETAKKMHLAKEYWERRNITDTIVIIDL